MPLIIPKAYYATAGVQTGAELLFNDVVMGTINTTLYHIDPANNQFVKLNTAPTLPTGIMTTCYSPDGTWLAVASRAAPYLQIFKRDSSGVYTQVAIDYGSFTAPTGECAYGRGISFTDDGSRMSYIDRVGTSGAIRTFTLKGDGSTYQQATSTTFSGTAYSACLSPNGQYLAFSGSTTTSNVYIYKWNGTAYVFKISAPYGSGVSNTAEWLDWSNNGDYLFSTTTNIQYSIVFWKLTTATDTVARQPVIGWGGGAKKFSLSPDNTYFAVCGAAANSSLFAVFKWNGANTLTNLGVSPPGGLPVGVSFSPDGFYVAVGGSFGTQYYQGKIYQRIGDAFTLLPNVLQTNTSFGANPTFRPVVGS